MNRYLDKVAGVAEDQARETIFKGNQEIRPYHNLTPEIRQALETGAVAGSAYLGSQALSHVHPGFGKAAPGVALAAGLYNATGLGSKLKASDREQERLISSLIRNRARDAQEEAKMQKSAEDRGYFDAAAVGGVSGGLTGALLGGSVGVAGGEATRDARIQASNITKGIGDYINSLPFVKSNVPPIEVPSRTTAILQGVGKGVKYGLMAGVPLGASLFMYNNYKRNQESNNPYLAKIAEVTVGQTMYDDAMTGAKLGVLAGSAPSVFGMNPIRAVGSGIVGGLGGMAVGALAGIPHGLLRNKNDDRVVRHSLVRPIASTMGSDAKEGLKTGAAMGAGLLGLGGGIISGKSMLQIMKERGTKVPTGKLLAAGLGTTATMAGIGALGGGAAGGLGGLAMGVPHGAAKSLVQDYNSNKYMDKVAAEDNGGGLGRMVGLGAGVGGVMGLGAGGLWGLVDHPFSTSQDTILNRLKHSGSTALKMGAGTALSSAALMGSLYGLGRYQQSHKKQAEQVWYDEPTELNKKAAEDNWRPDSYAHRLGWEDPRKAALKSAALTGLSYAPYANDMGIGDKVMAGSMAALSASGAHSEAEMKNRILQEILEAQEHGVHHGEMDLHHQLKEDIMSDPETSKWTGRVLGGLSSAALGGSLAHAVGGNGLAVGAGALAGGVLGGLGFGALGHYSAEADNRRVQGILDAREAYLRAKMVKKAEDEGYVKEHRFNLFPGLLGAIGASNVVEHYRPNSKPLQMAAGVAGLLGVGYATGSTAYTPLSQHPAYAYMDKKAEDEAVEHSYKPALTAGAIDAGMGLGLGALGQQISKRYLGGKYAPLVIGGLEGTAAMAATDMYQRSHEAQMEELKARLRG